MDIAGMLLKSLGIDNPEQMKADAMATASDAIRQFQELRHDVKIVMAQNTRILALLNAEPETSSELEADPHLTAQEFESASMKLIESNAV